MRYVKEFIKEIPIIGGMAHKIYRTLLAHTKNPEPFPGSEAYWETRYSVGGDSGVGSYGLFSKFKAEVINKFVAEHHVQTIIEFGCGDGNQLKLAKYPSYLGFDVSGTAVSKCREIFRSDAQKAFRKSLEYNGETADLALSLDVIYHLVEDSIFEHYMRTLFGASSQYVIIYASDSDDNRGCEGSHVKHRKFTRWISENLQQWTLVAHLPNRYPYNGDHRKGSFSDFFIYDKT